MAPEPRTEAELFQDRLDEAYRQITTLQQEKAALEGERDEALIFMRAMKGVAEHSQERAEQAEALLQGEKENAAHFQAHAAMLAEMHDKAEATTRRLREALKESRDEATGIVDRINSALTPTPEGEK